MCFIPSFFVMENFPNQYGEGRYPGTGIFWSIHCIKLAIIPPSTMYLTCRLISSLKSTGSFYLVYTYIDVTFLAWCNLHATCIAQCGSCIYWFTHLLIFQDCVKYEHGRTLNGQSMIVEWAKGGKDRRLVSIA